MSISKTLLFLISALFAPLFLLPACTNLLPTSRLQPNQAVQTMPPSPQPSPATQTIAAEQKPPATKTAASAESPADSAAAGLTTAEPDETEAQEIKGLEDSGNWAGPEEPVAPAGVKYDFPVVINKQVKFYLDFFENQQHRSFAHWLARSGRYLPFIKKKLKTAGLPLDLAYLPLIESGYSPTAYSRARAVGLWQFMRATARHYGLRVNSYVDERRDPIKATRAAIRYLTKLHQDLGSWQLAVAGYNAGEGKIQWAMHRADTDNFWRLSRYLNLETKRYVPKLIAAIIIAKQPKKYGFTDIAYEQPLDFEIAKVPRWTSLKAVAVAANLNLKRLHNLNRALRRGVTPPHMAHYPLKVPPDKAKLVARNLPRVRPVVTTCFKTHVVRSRRETLAGICRRYRLNEITLLKANDLRSARLRPGERLRIPYQVTSYTLIPPGRVARKPGAATAENLVLHTIRPGETVSTIAKRYHLPARLIVAWNHLRDINQIRAGQKLALYLATEREAGPHHGPPVIKPKTFKLAAAAPEVTASSEEIPDLSDHKKRPARKGSNPTTRLTYYRVRGGDTLWDIARKFNLSTDEIKRWNQLDGDTIHPGLRLLLRVAQGNADV